jgi:hypothetical protein
MLESPKFFVEFVWLSWCFVWVFGCWFLYASLFASVSLCTFWLIVAWYGVVLNLFCFAVWLWTWLSALLVSLFGFL